MTNPTAKITNTKPSEQSTPEEILWDVLVAVDGGCEDPAVFMFEGVPHRKMKAWAAKSADGELEVCLK